MSSRVLDQPTRVDLQFVGQEVEHVQGVRTYALLGGLQVLLDEVTVPWVLHRQHAHVELDHQRLAQLVAQVDVLGVTMEIKQDFVLKHVLPQKEAWNRVAWLTFTGFDS